MDPDLKPWTKSVAESKLANLAARQAKESKRQGVVEARKITLFWKQLTEKMAG